MKKIFILFFLISACHKVEETSNKEKLVVVDELAEDFTLPSNVWNVLESKPLLAQNEHLKSAAHEGAENSDSGHAEPKEKTGGEHGGGNAESGGHGGAASEGGHGGGSAGADATGASDGIVQFTPAEIELKEKNPGVLSHPQIRIQLPRGGGVVDFANFKGKNPGSFYLKINLPEVADPTTAKVYFYSLAKKRKIEDEVYGSGCRSLIDITQKFWAESKKDGIKANSTRDRHATLLGGRFFFTYNTGRELQVSQVTFIDSDRKDLSCDKP